MHERELKVLWRGGALLAAASVMRLAAGGPLASTPLSSPSVLDSLLTASKEAGAAELVRASPLQPGERIDPNLADADQLERLPGIGPALARRIVEERRSDGVFNSLADLGRVKGIGPRSLERLAPLIGLPTGNGETETRSPPVARESGSAGKIDVNRASAQELERLKGVGPVLAQRIVEFRKENGRFGTLSDLLRVPGIGPQRLQGILRELESSSRP